MQRVKIYLHIGRDPELIALRYNPAYDFSGLAKQVLEAYVLGTDFKISIPKPPAYIPRSLCCYMHLDEKRDMEIINLLNGLCISKSAFVRNLMLRSVDGMNYVYTDQELKSVYESYMIKRKQDAAQRRFEKMLKIR